MNDAFIYHLIVRASIIGSLCIYLINIQFADLLLRFFAIGELPGTSVIIPVAGMYVIILVVLIALTAWLVLPQVLKKEKPQPTKTTKRRYSRV